MGRWKGQTEGVTLSERLAEEDCRNLTMWIIRTVALFAFVPMWGWLIYGFLPSVAPVAEPTDSEWGWFLLGNQSLASPYAMEMSWLNHSAGRPELWTPPPRESPRPPARARGSRRRHPPPHRTHRFCAQNGASTASSRMARR